MKNAKAVVTVETINSSLVSLGASVEKAARLSSEIVDFVAKNGVDMESRKEFTGFLIETLFAQGVWPENPTKAGKPAVLDMVRMAGIVKGEKKLTVKRDQEKAAKGIYAAWQWLADSRKGDNEGDGGTDSLEKIVAALTNCEVRLGNFEGTDEAKALLLKAIAKLSA